MGLGLDITGTLQGLDPQTLAEALRRQQEEELATRTAHSAQAAQAAGQQYQQAAQAPPPGLNPFEQLIPALFGNVASVLSQNPAYQQQGQQEIQQSRGQLLRARAENIKSLQDIWDQKARAAQQAGDFEAEEKARMKREQFSKLYDSLQLNQQQQGQIDLERERQRGRTAETAAEHRNRLGEIAAQGAEQRKTLASKPVVSVGERSALAKQGIDPDSGLMLQTFATREITRRNQLAKSRDEKSRNQAVTEIQDIAYQRWASDRTPRDMGLRLIKLRHPFYKANANESRYLLTDEKVFKKIKGQWVKDMDAETRAKLAAKELVMPYFEQASGAQPR